MPLPTSSIRFNIDAWSAWAPGLASPEAWLDWARSPALPVGDGVPTLAEMPAMARRRVERLGRIALQAAYQVIDGTGTPLVFASRHGDMHRATALLNELGATGGVSPAGFSVSVHNAIGAIFSITRGDTAPLSAVAAGTETVEAGLLEACCFLADGAASVVLVVYDDSYPAIFAGFRDEPDPAYAWAVRISADGPRMFSLSCEASVPVPADTGLPHGLQALRFLLSDEHSLCVPGEGRNWRWCRHG